MTTAVLVTGGAGYVGSHACKALATAGFLPVAYDNLSRGHPQTVRWGPLETGDIRDRARLDAVLARWRPAAVLHFAAHAYVGESVGDPARYYANNVIGTLGLLDAMRAAGLDRMVFSSTCATFGVPDGPTIDEDTPQRPVNPYGAGKLMVERCLADYGCAYGLRAVSLRYFNACGADPAGEIGEDHDPETHLVPRALMAAAGDLPCLEVFGADYPTPDGTAVRDYVHVTDLAEAHVGALEHLLAGGAAAAFNLGSGRGHSVREVVAMVERVTGRPVPVRFGPRRPGDPPSLVACPDRARAALGFVPCYSSLEIIVRTAWRWQRQRQAAADTPRAAKASQGSVGRQQ